MFAFIQENETLLLILGIGSLVSFLLTIAVVSWILIVIPADYFSSPQREPLISRDAHLSLRIFYWLVKNLIGIVLVVLGIAMLVLPGQGLLTLLVGIVLLDFPRKYQLQKWLISREPVLKSANWLRNRGGKEPLKIHPDK